MPDFAPWELRVHRIILAGLALALVVGIVADLGTNGPNAQSFMAAAIGTVYLVGTGAVPLPWFRIRFGVEAITLTGAILAAVVLTLTGAADSPYLLLSIGPAVLATVHGGFRAGLTTGLLAAGLLALISFPTDAPESQIATGAGLYLVFVLLVGAVRRLLQDMTAQATELETVSNTTRQELASLEETHALLLRLSEDISAGRLNAVEVGATTLDRLLERFQGGSAKLVVDHGEGPVVLAARGIPEMDGYTRVFPLETADTQVGKLELTTPRIMTREDERLVETVIRPVSIAFANLRLLEDIVGAAVAEERLRLAREMHDEIGPSLASLGLSLDLTAMQQGDSPELVADLQVLRSNVTKLVDDVRETVADLRSAPGPTLTARILQATTTLDGRPEIVVDLDERRPPRPALIGDLTAMVTEAMRNAHRHSKASKVIVTGRVDRAFGSCSIIDDGIGFDPDHEPHGHFGLTGMRERAEKIGATIDFESEPGTGTTVKVEWGNK